MKNNTLTTTIIFLLAFSLSSCDVINISALNDLFETNRTKNQKDEIQDDLDIDSDTLIINDELKLNNQIINIDVNQAQLIEFETLVNAPSGLSYLIHRLPQQGELQGCIDNKRLTNKICTYIPNIDYSGEDYLIYYATDGKQRSNYALIKIFLKANEKEDVFSTSVAEKVLFSSGTHDLELPVVDDLQNVYSLRLKIAPEIGSLIGCESTTSSCSINYNLAANSERNISFSFEAIKDNAVIDELGFRILLKNIVNGKPTFPMSQSTLSVLENSFVLLNIPTAVDPESDALTYKISSFPLKGELIGCNPNSLSGFCRYEPKANMYGQDEVKIIATDGKVNSDEYIFQINIMNNNEAPVWNVSSQNHDVDKDSFIDFLVPEAQDVNSSDPISYIVINGPSNGSLENCLMGSRVCRYKSSANFIGVDSIKIIANDGQASSVPLTINFTVKDVMDPVIVDPGNPSMPGGNDNPTYSRVVNDIHRFATFENQDLQIDLRNVIISGAISLDNEASSGQLQNCFSNESKSCTYKPNSNFTGEDEIVLSNIVGDVLNKLFLKISVIQKDTYTGPQFPNYEENVIAYKAKETLIRFTPAIQRDGNLITYKFGYPYPIGDVSDAKCQLSNNSSGGWECRYQVKNAMGNSDKLMLFSWDNINKSHDLRVINVEIKEEGILSFPLYEVSKMVMMNTPFNLNLPEVSTNAQGVKYELIKSPSKGSLSHCSESTFKNCVYTPQASYSGLDEFTYKASTSSEESMPVTVKLNVIAPNNAPYFLENTESFEIEEMVLLKFTIKSAVDVENTALTYRISERPENGVVANCANRDQDLTCDYYSKEGFIGSDNLKVIANDGQYDSLPKSINIKVNEKTPNNLFAKVKDHLQISCKGCHGAGYVFGSILTWTTEKEFLDSKFVVAGSPQASKLYTELKGNSFNGSAKMPIGADAMTLEQLNDVKNWITNLQVNPGGGDTGGGDGGGSNTPIDNHGPEVPFACNANEELPETKLRRLTKRQLKNIYTDLLSNIDDGEKENIINGINSEFSKIPDDKEFQYETQNKAVSTEHVDKYINLSMALAEKLAISSRKNQFVGNCDIENNNTCQTNFIRSFLSRAFRRPLVNDEVNFWHNDVMKSVASGERFKTLLGSALASAQFIFIIENGSENQIANNQYSLSAYELASRLSLMFLQTIPDDQLWNKAQDGSLLNQSVYHSEVQRLMKHSKAREGIEVFMSGWLHLEKIGNISNLNDRNATPAAKDFYEDVALENLKDNAINEIYDFGQYYFSKYDQAKVEDLFTSRVSFAKTSDLASIYDIPRWSGNFDSKVMLPASGLRSGLLTRSALLLHSTIESRDILRGALNKLDIQCVDLGQIPNNAEENLIAAGGKSTRQQFEWSTQVGPDGQEATGCINCHNQINPLGFPLGVFDSVGRLRTHEKVYETPKDNADFVNFRVDPIVHNANFYFNDSRTIMDANELSLMTSKSENMKSCFVRNYHRFAYGEKEDMQKDACSMEKAREKIRSGSLKDMFLEVVNNKKFKTLVR